MRVKTRVLSIFGVICLQLTLGVASMPVAHASGPDPVTITKHTDVGFTTSVPVNVDTGVGSPPCLLEVAVCLFHGAIAFHGTMKVGWRLGPAATRPTARPPSTIPTPPPPAPVKNTPPPPATHAR